MLKSSSLRKHMETVGKLALITAGKKKDTHTFRRLLYNFTQNTTFHGVRYITADTQWLFRRLVWLLLVLGALSFFIWFMTDRLLFLRGHPKAVDVEVIYTESIEFPAVTICNQNLFRTSATLKLGLHDVVEESFKLLQNGYDKHDDEEKFDVYPDTYLKGMGPAHAVYVNITSIVCRDLCVKLHSESCCSVIFDRMSRTCFITALDFQSEGTSLQTRVNTVYYKRRKCSVQHEANCTFEDGLCSFVQDFSRSITWKRNIEDGKPVDALYLPPFDHTTMTGRGRYLIAATKFHQPNTEAHLTSPFILSGHDTCIHFYYQLHGGLLSIRIKRQTNSLETIWTRSRSSQTGGQWEKAYERLSPGYYRVVIEAKAGLGTDGINAAIDDVSIGPCLAENALTCKETVSGSGYSGSLEHSMSGQTCYPWSDMDSIVANRLWKSHNLTVEDEALGKLNNYCRNPDDDQRGPWCFTNKDTEKMEYCSIPLCDCRDVEFRCDNGRCISYDLTCNQRDDCLDNSDEIEACNLTLSLSCDFGGRSKCGYGTDPDSKLKWILRNHELRSFLAVDTSGGRGGDIASLRYPSVHLSNPACLHVEYLIEGDVLLDVLYKVNPHSETKERLCTLEPTDGWESSDVDLPAGLYQLHLDAIFMSLEGARVYIDLIELLDENCTRFQVYEPSLTDEVLRSYDFLFNLTENFTSNASALAEIESGLEPSALLNLTTILLDQAPVYTILHEPYAHPACVWNASISPSCRSCQRDLHPEECLPTMTLVSNASSNMSSRCPHVVHEPKFTLEECKTEALAWRANVFNYRDGHCAVKHCKNNRLHLTDQQGGYDVYFLSAAKEERGMSCRFLDGCVCGYQFVSSNIHLIWERRNDEKEADRMMRTSADYDNSGNDDDDDLYLDDDDFAHEEWYLYVVNNATSKPSNREWTRLVSPFQMVSETSCLRFLYFTRFMNLEVFRVDEAGRYPVLRIDHDGQHNEWHPAAATVPAGNYSLVFEVSFGPQLSPDNIGIDNVNVSRGSCERESTGVLDCSFDEDDFCGYQDVSEAPVKWVRSKTHDLLSPGGYYLRTSASLNGKSTVTLVSPYSEYENISCVQFFFFMQSPPTVDTWNTLTVSRQDVGRTDADVIWRMRSLADNIWHFAMQTVVNGQFRIIFEISGDRVRAGIDDVKIVDGECDSDSVNCSMDEYRCESHFACIPRMYVCDDMPNCDLAEDEGCSVSANETDFSEYTNGNRPTAPSSSSLVPKSQDPLGDDDSGDQLNNLTEIYRQAGHQGEDFIYACKWEGIPCSHVNFTKHVTDYGLCYTFNSDEQSKPLSTSKTGSRYGLSLTLNIEQYEYMRGPQNDAGIKVFLHALEELPQVRDLGFAIQPGIHSLVSIRLNLAENLPAPWGDCAEMELEFYDRYVHSRCLRECESKKTVEQCGCRDAYMPGKALDNPPVCNLTMYFQCAVPTIDSIQSSDKKCECPKPCNQTIYEPSLSQAALSVLSVDNILSENMEELQHKYHTSIEARQRVSEKIFVEDLHRMHDISRGYASLRQFAKTYLGDYEKSIFAKIRTVSGTLVNIFDYDIASLMEDLPSQMAAYNRFYKKSVQLLIMYISELDKDLQELSQMVLMTQQGAEVGTFLKTACVTLRMKSTLAQNNLDRFRVRIQNRTLLALDAGTLGSEGLRHTPVNFVGRRQECRSDMASLSDDLREIGRVMEASENWIEASEGENQTDRMKQVADIRPVDVYIRQFLRRSDVVTKCLSEFSDSLERVTEWRESARLLTKKYHDQTGTISGDVFDFEHEVKDIAKDERQIEDLLSQYASARISKMDLLNHFDSDPQSSTDQSVANINHFIGRIHTHLTDPLRTRIVSIRRDLQTYYEAAMEQASVLEVFFDPSGFYQRTGRMRIWRIPVPNFEKPREIQDKAREFWKVWNRDVSMRDFVATRADKFIAEGLVTFCSPLLHELEKFEQQLEVNKQKLLLSIQTLQTARKEYLDRRVINHNFVLENFLAVDVYFAQLKRQSVKQQEAYQTTQFLGDVGGFMGLLLGGSVLTVFELIDFIFFHYLNKFFGKPDNEAPKVEEVKDVATDNLGGTPKVTDITRKPTITKVSFAPNSNCV